jgi:hypothetical protein
LPPDPVHLQASLSLFVLIGSYVAQQRFRPFVKVKGLSEDLQHAVAALEGKLAQMRKESASRAHRRASSAGLSISRRAKRSLSRASLSGRGDSSAPAARAEMALTTHGGLVGTSPAPCPTAGVIAMRESACSSNSGTTSPIAGKPEVSTAVATPLTRVLRVMVYMVRGVVGQLNYAAQWDGGGRCG